MIAIDAYGQPVDPYAPLGECCQCGCAAWTTTAFGLLCPDHANALDTYLSESTLPAATSSATSDSPNQQPAPQAPSKRPAGGVTSEIVSDGRGGFNVYVTINGARQYVGNLPSYQAAERLARGFRFDAAVDGHCPEQAAQIAMEDDGRYPCPCGVSEPAYAAERAAATAPADIATWATPEATERITAAIVATITGHACMSCGDPMDRDNEICEACQEAGEPWPLSTERCCLCDSVLAYPGAPCGQCSVRDCTICRGPHQAATCPKVRDERLRQAREESAGRGVARAMRDDRTRFLRCVAQCGDADRQAMASALAGYLAAQTHLFLVPPMTPERILAHWAAQYEAATTHEAQ